MSSMTLKAKERTKKTKNVAVVHYCLGRKQNRINNIAMHSALLSSIETFEVKMISMNTPGQEA